MSKTFQTPNTNFVSYLRCKDVPILNIRKIEGQIVFLFDDVEGEVEQLFDEWSFNPNGEMRLVQRFVSEKDKNLKTIREKMNQI